MRRYRIFVLLRQIRDAVKKTAHSLFVLFIFVYACTTGLHIREIDWTLLKASSVALGISLAVFAHARRSPVALAILISHMAIEWFEWSRGVFEPQKALFNGLHAIMDFVFLSHELDVHTKKNSSMIMAHVITLLVAIFFLAPLVPTGGESIHALEPFVLGGVLGCIFSHLYVHLRQQEAFV